MDNSIPEFEIAFAGDVFLQTRTGHGRPFSLEVESLFRQIPWVFANLETVLAKNGSAPQKSYFSSADPEMAGYLKETGIKAVNLANNHIYDFGPEGFQQTITSLETYGINYFGVSESGMQKPFEFSIDGCKISICGYTIGSPAEGIAPLEEYEILKDIAGMKSQGSDYIIINLHWGEEFVAYPSPQQQRIARKLIDFGANVVIGHHPHVVQGIETYKDGVIFYSLGNFNFANSGKADHLFPGTGWGLIALIHITQGPSIQYAYIPVQIDLNYRPILVPQVEIDKFDQYLTQISEPLQPELSRLFWVQEASWPHFRNHIPSFIRRIRKYGWRHFYQMIRWLIRPANYEFYLGLVVRFFVILNPWYKSPQCPPALTYNVDKSH